MSESQETMQNEELVNVESKKNLRNENPNMIRCRKCHKWYDKTTARSATANHLIYDEEIDWTTCERVTRVYCPYCGYWHRA